MFFRVRVAKDRKEVPFCSVMRSTLFGRLSCVLLRKISDDERVGLMRDASWVR